MTGQPDPDETTDLGVFDAPEGGGTTRMARVNLLPQAFLIERRRRTVALVGGLLLIAYLAALGGIYAFKLDSVADAQVRRDAVETEVVALQGDLARLEEYQTLLAGVDARESLLTTAMDAEVSWARVLGDLALAFDRKSSLTALTASVVDEEAAAAGVIVGGDAATPSADAAIEPDPTDPIGEIAFAGYSVDRFAPGVRDVLAEFDAADGFVNSYLSLASDDERGDSQVTTFEGSFELTGDALTHRYDDGLPEESL